MVPANERPTSEDLESYVQCEQSPVDFAWTELYPQLCAWLNDREVQRARKEAMQADSHASGISAFNV